MVNLSEIIVGIDKKGREVRFSKQAINGHFIAFGKTGSGKTTADVGLFVQMVEAGCPVIAINWRHSLAASSFCPELKALYNKHRVHINVANEKIKIPMFTKISYSDGTSETDVSVVHRITSLLDVACDLTKTQKNKVYNAVKTVYEENLFSTEGISAVSKFLEIQEEETASSAAGRLRALTDENLIVNGDFLMKELEPKIYEIDLNGMQYDDQLVVVKFILDYLLRLANMGKFEQNGLAIFVDECHNLDFSLGSTMATFLNESRKLGICMILATPRMLKTSKNDMSVLQQCATVLNFMPFDDERRKIALMIDKINADKVTFKLSRLNVGEFIASGIFEINGKIHSEPLLLSTYIPRSQNDVCEKNSASGRSEVGIPTI